MAHVFVPFKIILNRKVSNLTLCSFSKTTGIREAEISGIRHGLNVSVLTVST